MTIKSMDCDAGTSDEAIKNMFYIVRRMGL